MVNKKVWQSKVTNKINPLSKWHKHNVGMRFDFLKWMYPPTCVEIWAHQGMGATLIRKVDRIVSCGRKHGNKKEDRKENPTHHGMPF